MAYMAKRRFNRKNSREAVKLVSSRGVEYTVFEDISAGGLRIRMERPVDFGAEFLAEFLLPYKGAGRYRDMNARIRVVRCQKVNSHYDVGAQFVDIDSEQKTALESSVDCSPGNF